MKITILGSCRQYSIKNYYETTSIQDRLTFPHYSKEIIQTIEYCKGIHNFNNDLTKYCFRSGILNRSSINYQNQLKTEFENTDLFVVEIASRLSYEWNNLYTHHILTESQYGFYDIPNIKIRDLSDEEIENDIIKIKELIYPKKLLIVPHVYTRTVGKRYELVKLLERITSKYDIPFFNPSEYLKNETDIYQEGEAFHYTNKGEEIIGKKYKNYIDTVFCNKTVVLVWKPSYNNYPRTFNGTFWGIGDMLRGAIGLYKLSKKYNFNLIVDKSLHPISQFLQCEPHPFSNYVKENHHYVPLIMPDMVESFIVSNLINSDNSMLALYSNMSGDVADYDITNEIKEFINNILTPTTEFNNLVQKYLSKLGPFNIIHYRLGDDELVRKSDNININNVYNHLLENYTRNSILLTDSSYFKGLVKSRNKLITVLNTEICHIGFSDSYEALRDTLIEFFILMNATHIKSYSSYGWISGFVNIVNKIYNIPLEGHKNCRFN